jgi:hypothetical protein
MKRLVKIAGPRLALGVVLSFCLVLPGFAEIVANLHRGVVAVEDHSDAQLQRATRAGLAQVLIKVSGDRGVLEFGPVRTALDRSRSFMQRYRYLRSEDGELQLQVHFDPQMVNDLLRDAGAPLWTANRPAVLVWLVAEDETGRHPVTLESNPDLLDAISRELERRGVPVVYPLHDLEDTLAVSVHDLWQLDQTPIGRASRRYGIENILVGRITALPMERWMGDWLYLNDQDTAGGSFYGEQTAVFSARAVDIIADRMAARYAVAAGFGGEEVLVRVDAVSAYSDYRQVLRYLEGIELVDAAWPAYVEGESVVFRLSAQADAEQLHRIIGLNRRLQRLEFPEPLDRGPVNLVLAYEWLP